MDCLCQQQKRKESERYVSLKKHNQFHIGAKQEAGYQLHRIQNGLDPDNWKSFQVVGSGDALIDMLEKTGKHVTLQVN